MTVLNHIFAYAGWTWLSIVAIAVGVVWVRRSGRGQKSRIEDRK
jgi:hypothetical protein